MDNIDLLDDLIICDKEAEDILRNIGAFLYEMECEDNPWGNHDELYKMTWEREWRY